MASRAKPKKMITITPLPPVRVFGDPNSTIHPSVEKGQIISITAQKGTKKHIMFKNNEYAKKVHPNQAQYLFYLTIGALGTGRGDRQLGFCAWAVENSDRDELKPLMDWDIIVEYSKRGGTMWYKITELLELCAIKTAGATRSWEKFPRPVKELSARQSTEKEVEVDFFLT